MRSRIWQLGFIVVVAVLLVIATPARTTVPALGQTTSDVATCWDSDGGIVPEVAGYVEGIGRQGFPYRRYDECETGQYEGYVKEFYCNGTTPWPVRIACENGCFEGACLTELVCTDNDGDGFAIEGGACGPIDCDDNNPNVYPGAVEICDNGIDDNCNGLIDGEDPACLVCTDNDGDGFAIEGGACGPIDCDDNNPNVYPGAIEICDNGIDDNCNGLIDDADPACQSPNIIIVGWDGVQRDHLLRCFNREIDDCPDGLPNLDQLSGGVIYNNLTSNGETSTKPGWAQLLTGYRAEVTGVLTNGRYQPIPEGYTLFEKVQNHFGADNIVTMFVSGKGEHTGGACIGEETTRNGQPVIENQGQPWCLTRQHLDYYENDLRRNNTVGDRALALLEAHQDDRFLALFLFREPDVTGHVAGVPSLGYSRMLIDVDWWLGRIMSKVDQLGIAGHTVIYVVTDHGFDEGSTYHHAAHYGFMASNDPLVMRSGDRMDFTPTILERYGISRGAIGVAPPVDGYSLYALPPFPCVVQGGTFIDYPGAPQCCDGLTRIGLDRRVGHCMIPSGGTGDNSGFCTLCGNGICEPPENPCNCPEDCPYY